MEDLDVRSLTSAGRPIKLPRAEWKEPPPPPPPPARELTLFRVFLASLFNVQPFMFLKRALKEACRGGSELAVCVLLLLEVPQSAPAPARVHGARCTGAAHQICILLPARFHHFFITPPCRLLCHEVAARRSRPARDAGASQISVRSMSEAAGVPARLGALCCYVARSVAITVPDDGGRGSERHYPASLWPVGATGRS